MNMQEFNFNEERPLTEVKLSEVNAMVKELFLKRAEVEEMQARVDEKSLEVETLKSKIQAILDAQNMTKLPTEYGLVYKSTKWQAAMPKDPVRAAQLRAYFAQHGLDDMLTVNHNTLNSYLKQRVFEVIGKDFDELVDKDTGEFRLPDGVTMSDLIPGIEEPTARVVLAMKKGK